MSACSDSNINKNYVVQSPDSVDIFSACTELYTNQLLPCSGDSITINSNLEILGNISGNTYFGDGSKLSGITTEDNYVTGGTYNDLIKLLSFSGTNSATTFTISLSAISTEDNYVTGSTYNTSGLTLDFFGTNSATTFSVNVSDLRFSGGSDNCIADLYVSNVYGCSPITIHDNIQYDTSTANSANTFVVVFGSDNTSSSDYTLIGGGLSNTITNSNFSTIGGGSQNIITDSQHSFIGGGGFDGEGYGHEIANYSKYSVIGGGKSNRIRYNSRESVIAGGRYNKIETYSRRSFIGGGQGNQIFGDSYLSFIGGGDNNQLSNYSYFSTIVNGIDNTVSNYSYFSTIVNGAENYINNSYFSTVIGGYSNEINHPFSTIIGSNITSVSANTTHVENLQIDNTPTEVNTLEDFLMRDTNGMIRTRSFSSLSAALSADTFVTGLTFNNSTFNLTANLNDNTSTLPVSLAVLASDVYVVSGVYSAETGVVRYTNSTGGTFDVSGFTTGMTDSYTTDAYLNGNEIRFDNNIQGTNYYNVDLLPLLSGKTDLTLFNSHTGDTSIHYPKSGITLSEIGNSAHTHTLSEITDFNSYSGSVQTQLNTKVESGLNVGGGNEIFSGKSGTTLVFRTLSGGSNTTITQIGDVQRIDVSLAPDNNTFVTGGTITGDTTLVLERNDDVNVLINGVVSEPLFNSHTGDTNNPHQTSFNNLTSTAHTHNISDIINLQNELDSKFDVTGGTINGDIIVNTISSTTINADTFIGSFSGDGSNLTGIPDNFAVSGYLSTNTLVIDRNDTVSAITVDLSQFLSTQFTGNTSGDCVENFYVENIHGCENVTFHSSLQHIGSTATTNYSVAFGLNSEALNTNSFAFGENVTASGISSFATGKDTIAGGDFSFTSGEGTHALGNKSFATGFETRALGVDAFAEGCLTIADGDRSHAQNFSNEASGSDSHAGGFNNEATGATSFVHSQTSSVYGDNSAILAGLSNTLSPTAIRSVILGGTGIAGSVSDMVYVPSLNINTLPTLNDSLTDILVRDSSGFVRRRSVDSIISAVTSADTFVTGYTYSPSNNTFTIGVSDGNTYSASILNVSGLTTTGTIDAGTLEGDTITSGGTNLDTLFTQQAFKIITAPSQTDVVADQIHDTLNFSGINISIITNPATDTITFSADTEVGEINTATNVGTGTGIFRDKTGTTINLKSLTSTGGTVFITENNDEVNLEVQHTVDTNTFVTGGTITGGTTLVYTRNDGVNLPVNLSPFLDNTDNYTTGGTYNPSTENIDFSGTNAQTTFSVDVSALLDDTNTFATGTTISGDLATLTRNDNVDVLKLSGGSNVSITSGATNLAIIDVTIPADTNTFVTGGTFDSGGTLTLTRNDNTNTESIDFTTTKRIVITSDKALAISAGRSYLNTTGASLLSFASSPPSSDDEASFNFSVPGDYVSGGTFYIKMTTLSSTPPNNEIQFEMNITSIDLGGDISVPTDLGISGITSASTSDWEMVESPSYNPVSSTFDVNKHVAVKINRDVSDAPDTYNGTAYVWGLVFEYTGIR